MGIPQIKINGNFLPVSNTDGGCAAVGQLVVARPIAGDGDRVPARLAVSGKDDRHLCQRGRQRHGLQWAWLVTAKRLGIPEVNGRLNSRHIGDRPLRVVR